MKLAPVGAHIQAGVSPHLDLLHQWQPSVVVVIDPGSEVNRIKVECPSTTVVGRIYVDAPELEGRIRESPAKAAEWAHQTTRARLQPGVDYWVIVNEILQDYAGLELLNRFEMERQKLAAGMYGCGLFGFSVGNPDMPEHDRMALWRQVYPALAMAVKHDNVLCVHQYGKKNLYGPVNQQDWFALRYEKQVYPRLPMDLKGLKTVVSEFGIDNMIWEPNPKPSGWKDTVSADAYVKQLIQAGVDTEGMGNVIGRTIFTLGHYNPWQTYDIAGVVAKSLATHYEKEREGSVAKPPPVVTPPPTTTPAEVRISGAFVAANMSTEEGNDYFLKDFWTTLDGAWNKRPGITAELQKYECPAWAREDYLKPSFDDAGASTHLFALLLDKNGKPKAGQVRFATRDGQHEYIANTGDKKSFWQNMFEAGSSAFWPDTGSSGPWEWGPVSASAPKLLGGGLPYRHHISMFGVWQERNGSVVKPPEPPKPGPYSGLLLPTLDAFSRISQLFGARYEHYMQNYGIPGHNGLDIAVPTGSGIYSVADGVVAWVGTDSGYGEYVRVWHPTLMVHSFYAHLTKAIVKAGQSVAAGSTIAFSGNSGNSTGPHLHFEIRLADKDGNYISSPLYGHTNGRVDPYSWYLAQGRLLR